MYAKWLGDDFFRRNLLNHFGKQLGLDSRGVPGNTSVSRYAEALAKAWNEYNDSRSTKFTFSVLLSFLWNLLKYPCGFQFHCIGCNPT